MKNAPPEGPNVEAVDDDFVILQVNRCLQRDLSIVSHRQDQRGASLPLLVVVGPPRSGTTYMSQMIARHLKVEYINNLMARFWLRPSAGVALTRSLRPTEFRSEISLESEFGRTSGPWGPNEFGYFWSHWLKLTASSSSHSPSPEHLAALDSHALQYVLQGELLGMLGSPLMLKSNILGFYARYLHSIHEKTLFILVHRDPVDASLSLIHAKRAQFGSDTTRWSLRPSSVRNEASGSIMYSVRQVVDSLRETRHNLELLPTAHSLEVSYEDLCLQPGATLSRIREAVRAISDYEVDPVGVPNSVNPRASSNSPDERSRISAMIAMLVHGATE